MLWMLPLAVPPPGAHLILAGLGRLRGRFLVHLRGGLHQDQPKTPLSSPPAGKIRPLQGVGSVLPPLSVGKMTLRPYGALNYSQNSAARVTNQCWLRHSSRKRPLKLSTNAFCDGLPGSMNRSSHPFRRPRYRAVDQRTRARCRPRSVLDSHVSRRPLRGYPQRRRRGARMLPHMPRPLGCNRPRRLESGIADPVVSKNTNALPSS